MNAEGGRRLREARKVKGWSQDRLSHESGVDQSLISRLERAVQWPTDRTKVALARALECHPHDLFPLSEEVEA